MTGLTRVTGFALALGFWALQTPAQAPKITAAVNGASLDAASPLAPGSIFSVFGTSLTDGTTSSAANPFTALPTKLSGARLLVNGVAAPLIFASPLQMNAQFPVELSAITSATIQVEVNGTATSAPFPVNVASYSPGIFTLDRNGSGPGAILSSGGTFRAICPQGRSDCAAKSAFPGQPIAVFMTGLGPVNGPWSSGQPAPANAPLTTTKPVVTIGGLQVFVSFSGLAPGYAGLYQVNTVVPSNPAIGDSVPVTVTIGGKTSNVVTLSIDGGLSEPPQGGGPPGGAVLTMAIDPVNHNTLYAGTNSGVFKTTNGGDSWIAANNGLTGITGTATAGLV